MGWVEAALVVSLIFASAFSGAVVVIYRLQLRDGALVSSGQVPSTANMSQVGEDAFGSERQKCSTAAPKWIDPEIIDIEKLKRLPIVTGKGFSNSAKRILDIFLSFSLLLFTIPLIIFVALAIKTDSSGPVLYRQARVGRAGKEFTILKFRTMCVDAESDGPKWASRNDPRVTRIGLFLRKTRIDEIPQAINILKGDMSFVGPRPERPEFTENLAGQIPNFKARTLVKPGLTGWAQVTLPYAANIAETRQKLSCDLYYIENYSFLLDLLIIMKTFRVALFTDSAH